MNSPFKRTLVTAALPYANGPKHIGHLAGAYLPSDIYVRYKRLKQEEVLFVCGSDEHGTAITLQAIADKTTPQAIIDTYHALLQKSFEHLGISFDIYHRTSSALHHETSQEFFLDFYNKGLFEEKETMQFYDEEAQVFLADRYIYGECPNCHYEKAYGDQCEKCGKSLSPEDLINPKSTLSSQTPVQKSTKHWYLPLQNYEPWLKEWLLEGHKDWKSNTYGQSKSWIEGGLNARAMTRDGEWGVKVPLPDAAGKVLYVWFDAPIGYISATKQWALDHGQDWKKWWQSQDTRLLHFVGKDNIVFHCIIFPIMLHATGTYIVPDNVPANEFLNLEGDKMSTSRKWSIEMHDYIAAFPDKTDVLRYTLCANMPENKDSEFTWKDFQTRNNSELVAILGNLVNRVAILTQKNFDNKVPQATGCSDLEAFIKNQKEKISELLEQFKFREALTEVMNVARHGNKLLTEKEPWKLIKTDVEATGIVLYDCLQIIANISILIEPFLPFTAQKIRSILNQNTTWNWSDIGRQDLVAAGSTLGEISLLFDKIEDDVIQAQIDKLQANALLQQAAPAAEINVATTDPNKPQIQYDDFSKMQIVTGTILAATKVPKADKLLQLTIDIGWEQRTVVSGIAEHFSPEEIIGRQVSLLANLAPRKLKGIESQGMILMAEDSDGKLQFVAPSSPVSNGSEIR